MGKAPYILSKMISSNLVGMLKLEKVEADYNGCPVLNCQQTAILSGGQNTKK